MDGFPFVMSHFEDKGKDYHLMSQFFCKLLQIFSINFILQFFGEIHNFFKLYFFQKGSNRKFKISMHQNKDNITGNHMKKNYIFIITSFINFSVFPPNGGGGV